MRMTLDEIKLVSFILVALVVGAFAKHYRSTNQHPVENAPATKVTDAASSRSW